MNQLGDRFFARGREFLGVDYPFICGAMTWVSDPALVAAVTNAGGFACLAGGNTPVPILRERIEGGRGRIAGRQLDINLITIAPAYRDHLEMIDDVQLPFVIFAGGFPRKQEIDRAKATGARVMCFASTLSIARRMQRYGADAIILEGMEAGGHVGHVSLIVLLQQVLFELTDLPVFVAGGIADGRMCAHLLLMGAAGVQMGTLFAVAAESCAHPAFKDRFVRANARDAVSTPQFDSRLPVVAVRALRNRGLDEFGALQLELIAKLDRGEINRTDAQEQVESYWMGALRRAVMDGDTDAGSLMSGQSVGLVDRIEPVADIIRRLTADTEAELQRAKAGLCD